ncbi:MAG: T9SS type A sorting domain-containing protein [Flavobacteriaceae bacterium]
MKTILFITKVMLFFFIVTGQAQQTYVIDWGMGTSSQEASITIETGDTIKWIWVDSGMPHDVSSIDPNAPAGFGSPMMSNLGYEYSFTFNEETTFDYRCAVHPGTMFGTITVEGGTVEEVVTIPDNAFKAYLVGNAAINLNSDTEIQVSEAIAFSGTMDCSESGIEDLTGIEAFTALTGLNCSNNMLTSIDVSSNPGLLVLSCSNNDITTLDLSNNLLLMDLYCGGNMLTTLDLSSLTDLSVLDCSSNDLSVLNVSNNMALTDLYCSDLHIMELDLSGNSGLTTIDCSNNHLLSSLNVQNGNNTNVVFFSALGNTELDCIQVDDANYSTTNWTDIEAGTIFSENCSASLNDFAAHSFSVYPNPAKDILTIESLSAIQTYRIFDIQGKQLTEKTTNSQSELLQIDISSFENGIYFLEVSSANEKTATFKIIKS